MKRLSLLLPLLAVSASVVAADSAAERLAAALERRLQSLKSLEILYEADDPLNGGEAVRGRMIWVMPDRFYHDTPEWTLCERGGEQWRLLKEQRTLILERAAEESEWSCETVLFHISRDFRAVALDTLDDGRRVLALEATGGVAGGWARLEFAPREDRPDRLEFQPEDGNVTRYRILDWRENTAPDTAIFAPPQVPPENVIDFRAAGAGR